jgi:hypothetical protein
LEQWNDDLKLTTPMFHYSNIPSSNIDAITLYLLNTRSSIALGDHHGPRC